MYTIEEIYKAYSEACNGINIEENQEIIIQGKIAQYAYMFANHIKNSNIQRLQQVIIDDQNPCYAFYFALDIKETNIQKLSEVVIHSKVEYWIRDFYNNIPHDKFDTSKFETYLTFM